MNQTLRDLLAVPYLPIRRTLKYFVPGPRPVLRILYFHALVDPLGKQFRSFLEQLQRRHEILNPAQAQAILGSNCPVQVGSKIPCLLTFDDGFRSHLELARVLDTFGFKGLFFVCPGIIDLSAEEQATALRCRIFDGNYAAVEALPGLRLMDWADIKSLVSRGHGIGAHGANHRRLSHLDTKELNEEVIGGTKILEERLKTKVHWFAYPFGEVGSISVDALRVIAASHLYCRSGVRGDNSVETSSMALLAQHVSLDAGLSCKLLCAEGGLNFLYTSKRRRLSALLRHSQATSTHPHQVKSSDPLNAELGARGFEAVMMRTQ